MNDVICAPSGNRVIKITKHLRASNYSYYFRCDYAMYTKSSIYKIKLIIHTNFKKTGLDQLKITTFIIVIKSVWLRWRLMHIWYVAIIYKLSSKEYTCQQQNIMLCLNIVRIYAIYCWHYFYCSYMLYINICVVYLTNKYHYALTWRSRCYHKNVIKNVMAVITRQKKNNTYDILTGSMSAGVHL